MINFKEKQSGYELTVEDITGYSIAMYLDGFETSGSAIHFILYDLGSNLHIQNRLRDYLTTFLSQNSEGLTYKVLQEMQLLDQVISGNIGVTF